MKNEIAQTIAAQVGRKALYMIGAKNLVAGENYLAFKVMRNNKGVNYIKITLNSLDLYDIEFMYVTMKTQKVKAVDNGLYSDMICRSIEQNTELYTKL